MGAKASYALGIGALGVSAAGAVVAVLATRPKLAAKVFGEATTEPQLPADFGLDAEDVIYSDGMRAWWIPAPEQVGSVVIVHGFDTGEDPRSTDPGPRLAVAAMLARHGFGSLVISLGYAGDASGSHLHSGGELESDDVAAAYAWAEERSGQPVALFGFSAGGHACVLATGQCRPFAVVTDSSMVDMAEVIQDQAAEVIKLPSVAFFAAPLVMRLLTGRSPVDLGSAPIDRTIPMLHLHGDADTAINYANMSRLSALTGGVTRCIPGADHLEGFHVDASGYETVVVEALTDALP